MLVNLSEMLDKAAKSDYAVAGFNVYGYEDAKAVINAAEELKCPVILMTNKDAVEHMPVELLGQLLCKMAQESSTQVCVHLDHSNSLSMIERAVNSGFTSVMFDGSQLPLADNILRTKEVVNLAKKHNVSVEAEIGSVGYSDPSITARAEYTDPDEAKQFELETGVSALAVAVGTVHRMTTQGAKLDFDLLNRIQEKVEAPLVIHGSSGIADEDLKRLVKSRVAKVNLGTSLRMAFGNNLRQEILDKPNEFDRIKLFKKPMAKVQEEAKKKLQLLGN